jgi:site-specific DNA recombinase
MYVPSNTPKYVCGKCRNKIPIIDLDAVFYEQLRHFFLSPDDIAEYLTQADETIKQKEELLHVLEREQAKVQAEMDKTYRLYLEDQITKEGFGSRYKPMEARLAELQDQVPRLQAEVDFLKIRLLSRDEILSEAQSLYDHWPELPFEDKRKIVEAITEKITIGDGEISIDLCYLPTPLPQSSPKSLSPEIVARGQRDLRDSSRRRARSCKETPAPSPRERW